MHPTVLKAAFCKCHAAALQLVMLLTEMGIPGLQVYV